MAAGVPANFLLRSNTYVQYCTVVAGCPTRHSCSHLADRQLSLLSLFSMAKAALLVLLAIFGAASTARTPRPHPAPSAPREPAPAPTWNAHGTFLHATAQANDDGTVNVTLSCTMTPLASLGVVDDTEHMALCEDLLARLHAEMLLRFDDKQVLKAVACRERGAQHGNPHLQMHYTVVVHASKYGSPTAQRQFVEAERKWLKALLDQWSPQLTVRLSMKTVKPKDVDYGFGYDLKDEGLAHFVGWVIGLNSSEIQHRSLWSQWCWGCLPTVQLHICRRTPLETSTVNRRTCCWL